MAAGGNFSFGTSSGGGGGSTPTPASESSGRRNTPQIGTTDAATRMAKAPGTGSLKKKNKDNSGGMNRAPKTGA